MDGIRLIERFPRQVLNHVEHHKVSTPTFIEEKQIRRRLPRGPFCPTGIVSSRGMYNRLERTWGNQHGPYTRPVP